MGNTNDGNTKLIEKLRAFQEGVNDRSNLEAEFSKLAEYLLGSGHFSVDYGNGDGYDIYLKDIEFYFHEEQGPEKDYIVYHRDNHKDYKPVIEDKTRKYLPVGSFYGHISGIDLTFENEAEHYRASCLLRGFKVMDKKTGETFDETRPTYLYEYLVGGLTNNITWVESDNDVTGDDIDRTTRKNVYEYDDSNAGNPKKNEKEIDKREWRYYIKGGKWGK